MNTGFGEPATAKINEAEIQVMAARIERMERFAGELELQTTVQRSARTVAVVTSGFCPPQAARR